ncbi:uncharacterized protein LOC122853863 [Aphidius gifuensis]|uniref:uncharacterized protein LOC122853863 n=1 Tax=Aphidius gifuensis TaxID=684658 RepID=UPI001CDB5E56|nr:uncharacterized protein LOC122853863 [Aphidius gifuensis]
MGRTCIVRDCYEAKNTLFSVPKDSQLFDAWKSNLPELKKPLSTSSYVCEKHFHPSDLITHYVQKLPSETWSYPFGRKRLKPKAVPLSSNIYMTSDNGNLLHTYIEPINSNVDKPIVPIENSMFAPNKFNN